MVTSANATDDQNRIVFTIRTTNVSTELINFGLKHEQAQVQKLTDNVLGAMRAGGVTQPGLEIRILNQSGDALKILKIEWENLLHKRWDDDKVLIIQKRQKEGRLMNNRISTAMIMTTSSDSTTRLWLSNFDVQ